MRRNRTTTDDELLIDRNRANLIDFQNFNGIVVAAVVINLEWIVSVATCGYVISVRSMGPHEIGMCKHPWWLRHSY